MPEPERRRWFRLRAEQRSRFISPLYWTRLEATVKRDVKPEMPSPEVRPVNLLELAESLADRYSLEQIRRLIAAARRPDTPSLTSLSRKPIVPS